MSCVRCNGQIGDASIVRLLLIQSIVAGGAKHFDVRCRHCDKMNRLTLEAKASEVPSG